MRILDKVILTDLHLLNLVKDVNMIYRLSAGGFSTLVEKYCSLIYFKEKWYLDGEEMKQVSSLPEEEKDVLGGQLNNSKSFLKLNRTNSLDF